MIGSFSDDFSGVAESVDDGADDGVDVNLEAVAEPLHEEADDVKTILRHLKQKNPRWGYWLCSIRGIHSSMLL